MRLVYVFVLVLMTAQLMGQTTFVESKNTFNVSFSKLFSLTIPAVVVSSYRQVAPRTYVEYGGGYIFRNTLGGVHRHTDIDSYHGVRLRGQIRYLFPNSRREGRAWYVSLVGKYSYVAAKDNALFWLDDFAYARFFDYKIKANRWNYNIGGGYIVPLNEDFSMDIGVGLGRAWIRQRHVGIPENSDIDQPSRTMLFQPIDGSSLNGISVDFEWQIQVCYLIN